MPRGIPNNPVKQTSPAKLAKPAKRRRRKLVQHEPNSKLHNLLTTPSVIDQAQDQQSTAGVMSPAQPPDFRRQRDFATVTYRTGSIKGSAIEKIREDLAELNIRTILVEHNVWEGSGIPVVVIHSVYN